ncbi:sulfate adenylyltransferase subunit CysN, partial [Rhizobium leguminosarum]
ETLELATVRSSQTVDFHPSVQRVSRPGESFRCYQGTVAGGSVKPGDSFMILPSGMVANVSKIVTFDLCVEGKADLRLGVDRND